MSQPTAKQQRSGIWIVDFEDLQGNRRRISTGIKTARRKLPPPEVKARLREIVLEGYRDPPPEKLAPPIAARRAVKKTPKAPPGTLARLIQIREAVARLAYGDKDLG